jgi:glycosyltransferase involved in cell wall biosynthesis
MSNADRENSPLASIPPGNFFTPRLAILMCTKNGAAFIDEQLKSIADQTHKNWILIVSDDGSTDPTVEKLQLFAKTYPQRVIIKHGPGKGVCANFLSLANDSTIDADYFAFSDQDDVWHQNKLRRALGWLATVPAGVPTMYCGRTELIDAHGKPFGLSPRFSRRPAFQNALVENLGGGNTMVFNRAAKKILEEAGALEVVLHDWWVYQLVSAAGGRIYYDQKPMLRYRQHPDNVVGSKAGWGARFVRLGMVLGGRFQNWNEVNINALRRLPAKFLHPSNRMILERFIKARSGSLPQRLYYLKRSGVYRQTLTDNLALLTATMLKRI